MRGVCIRMIVYVCVRACVCVYVSAVCITKSLTAGWCVASLTHWLIFTNYSQRKGQKYVLHL